MTNAPESRAEAPPSKLRRVQVLLTPLGFMAAPLLSIYVPNRSEVPFSDLFRPGVIVALAALLLGTAAYLLLRRDLVRSMTVFSGLLLLFFSFDTLQRMFDWFVVNVVLLFAAGAADWNTRIGTLLIWVLLCTAITVLGIRAKQSRLVSVITPLSAISATLLVLQMGALLRTPAAEVRYIYAPPARRTPDRTGGETLPVTNAAPSRGAKPDVYLVVLDAYGRQDKLKKYFGFDNEEFLRKLETRGFSIARQGRANYNQTALSLASCLNLNYIPQLFPADQYPDDEHVVKMTERIDRNRVAAFLRTAGYRFVSIPTGTPLTATPSADLILDAPPQPIKPHVTELEGLILDTTPFRLLPRPDTRLYEAHRHRIRSAFDNLPRVAGLSYPKFVFAHILAPHPPFVFGPDGDTATLPSRPYTLGDGLDFTRRSPREEYQQQYPQQVRYVNDNILRAIDGILATTRKRNAPQPLIVLIGDHGSRMNLDWQYINKTDLGEPFGNLEAVLLPPGDAARILYPGVSPVNLFRILLSHYFGADYPRLPDRSFYSTLLYPYRFTDVTHKS